MLGLPDGIQACLFDLDGVLTKTAVVHVAAWKSMFDEYLRCRADREHEPFAPFEQHDYEAYVDGKQRADGVRSFRRDVLRAAGVIDLFEEIVDGHVAHAHGLRGKPAPDTFLAGARALGAEPPAASVFEDALAGVEAGRAGGFGHVVGVDRVGQADALREHGADVIAKDLAELLERP